MIGWVVGASGVWGSAVCRNLILRGGDVVAIGRRAPEALRVEFEPLDLTLEPVTVERRLCELVAARGAPDALFICSAVTNAGREALIRADYLGPAAIVAAVADAMAAARGGRIGVFLAQNARLGMAGLGEYSAAQAALWTWCEAKQAELRATPSAPREPVTLTRVIPPRVASATQRWVAAQSGHMARLHEPDATGLVAAVLAGKRRAGRRPTLAALSTLFR